METSAVILIILIVIFGLILKKTVDKKITVKQLVFVSVISAMGTALAVVSFVPILPNVNVDLSHIATFIVAIAAGPYYGMITGVLIGIYPATVFGNPLVPVGKAFTGFLVGLLAAKARLVIGVETKERMRVLRIVPTVVVSWIPEALFIILTLGILGIPTLFPSAVVKTIIAKGTVEIILLGFICELLFASKGLKNSLKSLGI